MFIRCGEDITQQSLLWENRSASFFSIFSFTLKRYQQRLQNTTAFDYYFFNLWFTLPLPQLRHGHKGWNGNVAWFQQGEKWTFKVEKSFFFNLLFNCLVLIFYLFIKEFNLATFFLQWKTNDYTKEERKTTKGADGWTLGCGEHTHTELTAVGLRSSVKYTFECNKLWYKIIWSLYYFFPIFAFCTVVF